MAVLNFGCRPALLRVQTMHVRHHHAWHAFLLVSGPCALRSPLRSTVTGRASALPLPSQNNDATFSKFMSLNDGDKYIDPKRRALMAEAEKAKGNVTDKPFKMASPMKHSVGPGGYYGTISGKLEHLPVSV